MSVGRTQITCPQDILITKLLSLISNDWGYIFILKYLYLENKDNKTINTMYKNKLFIIFICKQFDSVIQVLKITFNFKLLYIKHGLIKSVSYFTILFIKSEAITEIETFVLFYKMNICKKILSEMSLYG